MNGEMLSKYNVYYTEFKDQTPEELNFNYHLETLRLGAKLFKIKGYSKMSKIVLCLNIEEYLSNH